MLFETIIIILTVITLLIASYTDIKTREIPDWITYGLIFAALGIRGIFAFEFGWEIFVSGIFGLIVCLVIAYGFYFAQQWGGGDSKLLMGMGAIIGISYPFSELSFMLLWFFIALLLLGSVWGLLWMGYVAIKNKKKFKIGRAHV